MFNRKKLDREKLEYIYTHLLMANRPIVLICGLVLLLGSTGVLIYSLPAGVSMLVVACFLLMLSSSFRVVRITAMFGAWVATLGRNKTIEN